jgi:hypothetical protein
LSRRSTDTGTNTIGRFDFGPAASVEIDVATIRQGLASTGAGTGDSQGDIEFSNTGTNTVRVTTWQVGEAPAPGNSDVTSDINFGSGTNDVFVDNWDIGRAKSLGSVTIDAGGTLTVAGDTVSQANLHIGENVVDTGVNNIGTFNMAGGTFNATLNELTIARHNQGAGSSDGTLTFTAGTVTANSVILADTDRTGASTTDANTDAILNINGSTASLIVAGTISSEGGDAVVNLTDGTLRFVELVNNAGTFDFNWLGGTIGNVTGQNLTVTNVTLDLLTAATHTFDVQTGQTAMIEAGGFRHRSHGGGDQDRRRHPDHQFCQHLHRRHRRDRRLHSSRIGYGLRHRHDHHEFRRQATPGQRPGPRQRRHHQYRHQSRCWTRHDYWVRHAFRGDHDQCRHGQRRSHQRRHGADD